MGDNNLITVVLERISSIEVLLKGLIEINARLTQEIIHLKTGGTSSGLENRSFTTSVEPKKSGIVININGEIMKFSGNTYKYRSIFGENGGSWNTSEKVWQVPTANKDTILENFRENNIEHEVHEVITN